MIITYPGADAGYRAVIGRLEAMARSRPETRMATGLGEDGYCSLLREADVMIGNSSSGLIEAPSFGLPVVNVGSRQRGRLRAVNVIDVEPARGEIVAGVRRAVDAAFGAGLAGLANPDGDGHAAPRIVEIRPGSSGSPPARKRSSIEDRVPAPGRAS